MEHSLSVANSDDSFNFEGFTPDDIAEVNTNCKKMTLSVQSQSSSDVESDINVTESESEISTSNHGNNLLQSTKDNSSIASESLPPDDNNTEHSDLSDDGSNDFDLNDIVDTDNIMQNNGEGSVMTEILNKPIMWTSTFRNVYTKPFIHPSGPNLPAEFDVANATHYEILQSIFHR